MTHRDRIRDPSGRRNAAGDACIGKVFRRPPTAHEFDRPGVFPGLSDGVALVLRCRASLRQALLAENPGKASLWVIISEPWYQSLYQGLTSLTAI